MSLNRARPSDTEDSRRGFTKSTYVVTAIGKSTWDPTSWLVVPPLHVEASMDHVAAATVAAAAALLPPFVVLWWG